MESSSAILLRKIKLTESSLILCWLSESSGLFKTVAKGARSPKSKFAGKLDLFFQCEIEFSRSRKSELHILREASVLQAYEGIRTDYLRVTLAAYFIELLELVTEPSHPAPELFDLLQRALAFLDKHTASQKALLHFEAELARLLGIEQPSIAPAIGLGRLYHRLPKSRPALLNSLGQRSGALTMEGMPGDLTMEVTKTMEGFVG